MNAHVRQITPQPTEPAEFRFCFEELALVSEDGFAAGLISGSAQISYWREDGYSEWCIGKIYLEGHRKATAEERANGAGMFIRRDVELEYDHSTDPDLRAFTTKLYLQIFGELDGEESWKELIDDAVNKRLAAEAA